MAPMRFVMVFCLGLLASLSGGFSPVQATAADACLKSCKSHIDCGIGALCSSSGQCEAKDRHCANERWSVNNRSETGNCGAYICDEPTGQCLRKASSSQHCSWGYAYDGASACVPSIACDTTDPECQKLMSQWQTTRAQYEIQTPEPKVTVFSCVPCGNHSECESTKMCWQNRCTLESSYCSWDAQGIASSFNKQGLIESCGHFQCEKVSGQCLKVCLSHNDCIAGKSCVAGACL